MPKHSNLGFIASRRRRAAAVAVRQDQEFVGTYTKLLHCASDNEEGKADGGVRANRGWCEMSRAWEGACLNGIHRNVSCLRCPCALCVQVNGDRLIGSRKMTTYVYHCTRSGGE